MKNLSRRDFGKGLSMGALSVGALGGLVAPLARGQGASSQSPKRMTTALRELINSPGIYACIGVYDPITAKIAEQVGFRALDLAGSALGYATCMMEPNLCLQDMAEVIQRITAVVNIPIQIDCLTGFGEPAHVVHTVRVLENAGAAGLHISDQIYPSRFHYHVGVEHTISFEAYLDKVHYALQARRDPDFVINAHVDAFRTVSFAEGVRRCNLALEAGASLVLPIGLKSAEEVKKVPHEIHGPINGVGGSGPLEFSLQELEAMGGYKGYKLVNYPGLALVNYKASRDMLMHLKETGKTGMDPAVYRPISKMISEAAGLPEYIAIEKATTEKD